MLTQILIIIIKVRRIIENLIQNFQMQLDRVVIYYIYIYIYIYGKLRL
jgi:hypothetical protein